MLVLVPFAVGLVLFAFVRFGLHAPRAAAHGEPAAPDREAEPQSVARRIWISLVLVVLALGVVVTLAVKAGASPRVPSGPTGPLLAPITPTAKGKTVNGIQCLGSEQLQFHEHAHLAVFVDGQRRTIPAFIGFAQNGRCVYWMHSHTPDGVIHMESPENRVFTLGDYFAVWGQPLGPNQVGPATGTITAFVDGKLFTGDPRTIKLGEHVNVQLDVGKVVKFKKYTYGPGF